MTNLRRLQGHVRTRGWQAFLVPSNDEYLSEFSQPFARRLHWTTGFGGSTGVAIVFTNHAALCVDGRYSTQAARDTKPLPIEIMGDQEASSHQCLQMHLQAGATIALDGRLHSYLEVQRLKEFTTRHGIRMVDVPDNPVDMLWGSDRPKEPQSTILDYPTHYAGDDRSEKIQDLCENLRLKGIDFHLVADPEDVAWLLNVRTHDSLNAAPDGWHIVPVPLTRALVAASGQVFWFVDHARVDQSARNRLSAFVEVIDPANFEAFLGAQCASRVVSGNLRRTGYRFGDLVARVGRLIDDPVLSHRRWLKHPNEVQRAREGHYLDGQAVIRFLAWLDCAIAKRTITELEASRKLIDFRRALTGYLGPSMPSMSASGS